MLSVKSSPATAVSVVATLALVALIALAAGSAARASPPSGASPTEAAIDAAVAGEAPASAFAQLPDGGFGAGTGIEVPRRAGDDVQIDTDGGAVGVGIPVPAQNRAAVVSDGTVVYDDAADSSAVAAQPVGEDGVRLLINIADASAPKAYRFPLDLPAGAHAELAPDGSVDVLDADGKLLGGFAAPWAKGADGSQVPTRFSLEGGALVQHVDFDENSAFPIVADPNWWKIAKCVGSIASAVAGVGIPVSKVLQIKKLANAVGGYREAAKLLLGASSYAEKIREIAAVSGAAGAEILGIAGIRENCF